jgi:hypothetical protein
LQNAESTQDERKNAQKAIFARQQAKRFRYFSGGACHRSGAALMNSMDGGQQNLKATRNG